MSERLIDVILDTVKGVSDRLSARLTDVERRLEEIETRSAKLEYRGVYRPEQPYVRGSLVTRKGSLWLALHDNPEIPGHAESGWLLVVKRGSAEADDPVPPLA